MQTKKRAKSVKFGKPAVKEVKELKETKEAKEVKDVKIPNPAEEDVKVVQEIKQKIEEKIHPKEEENLSEAVELEREEIIESVEPQSQVSEDVKIEEKKSEFGSFINENIVPPKRKSNNLAFFIMVVLVTFLIGLLAIGGFYYFSGNKMPDLNLNFSLQKPTPTAIPTAVPSPTAKPADLSAYNIKILNGSGKTGEAAKVKSALTAAGFKVGDIGNADASDYTKTTISAKNEVNKDFLQKLTTTLSESYILEEKIEKLSDVNTSDVIITIGSETK